MKSSNLYYIPFCEKKHIKNQTKGIKSERLNFRNGKALGDIDISKESGVGRRKLLRIIEKKVCQNFHAKSIKNEYSGNYSRYHERHRIANSLKNVYGKKNLKYLFTTSSYII